MYGKTCELYIWAKIVIDSRLVLNVDLLEYVQNEKLHIDLSHKEMEEVVIDVRKIKENLYDCEFKNKENKIFGCFTKYEAIAKIYQIMNFKKYSTNGSLE